MSGFVHVSRDGKILVDGEHVGTVERAGEDARTFGLGGWRAEVDLAPNAPGLGLHVGWGRTRKAAVAAALEGTSL